MQGTGMTYCTNLKIFNNRAFAASAYKPGGAIYANTGNNVIKNCLIYNNSGNNAIYINGGKRGYLVGISPDVLNLLNPTLVEVAI